jgi:hypothetical protein
VDVLFLVILQQQEHMVVVSSVDLFKKQKLLIIIMCTEYQTTNDKLVSLYERVKHLSKLSQPEEAWNDLSGLGPSVHAGHCPG